MYILFERHFTQHQYLALKMCEATLHTMPGIPMYPCHLADKADAPFACQNSTNQDNFLVASFFLHFQKH